MAHKVIDRCKETTSTTGTGTLTLTGAVANFVAMSDATAGLTTDGDTSWFCAENGAEWEVFLGTRVDATHLARTTVISSSNAGAAVSFTAPPTVFGTVPASKLSTVGPAFSAYRGTSSQSISSGVSTKIAFNAVTFDTAGCFDSTTNNRFQPNVAGYYHVEWLAYVGPSSGYLTSCYSFLAKNGVEEKRGMYIATGVNSLTVAYIPGSALVYMNGTTDYLEVFANLVCTGPIVVYSANGTFFSGHFVRGG